MTIISLLAAYILLIWFVARWFRLASLPDRRFSQENTRDGATLPEDAARVDEGLSVAPPAHIPEEENL